MDVKQLMNLQSRLWLVTDLPGIESTTVYIIKKAGVRSAVATHTPRHLLESG